LYATDNMEPIWKGIHGSNHRLKIAD
jgi:hypothetical protein